jgi:ankyrin repeat protein
MSLATETNHLKRAYLKPKPCPVDREGLTTGRVNLIVMLLLLVCLSLPLTAQQTSRQATPADRAPTTQPQPTTQPHRAAEVQGMAFSPDSGLLATAGTDGAVKLWDVNTGKSRYGYTADASWPISLAFSADSKTLAIFVRFGKLLLRDLSTGRLVRTLDHGSEPAAVAVSPDGKTLALGGHFADISLWNYRTGQRLRAIRTHVDLTGEVAILAFSPDGTRLACAGGDGFGNGEVEIWNVQTGPLVATLNSKSVHSVAFSPDGKTLAVGIGGFVQEKPIVELWNLAQHKVVTRLRGHEFDPISLAFSRDGRRIAAGDAQGLLTVWDIPAATILRTMGVKDFVVHSTVSPGAQFGATADHASNVRLYDLSSGKLLYMLSGPGNHITVPPLAAPTAKESGTPTSALKAALTTMGDLGDPQIRNTVHGRIKTLLAAGADPNAQGGWGTSALMFLSACGDIDGVRNLLMRKANVNLVDVYGSTALLHAVVMGHEELVPILLDAGADLKDEHGESLLKLKGDSKALSAALLRIVKLGENPFKAPVRNFNVDGTASMLLELGADPNSRDADGNTPIAYTSSVSLLKALLLKGAKTTVRNNYGTPVIVGLAMTYQTAAVKLLLDHGADINAAEKQGWTALMYAAQNGYSDLAELLLARGADPNHATEDGRTPLMLAIDDGHLQITNALLAKKAKVNVKDDQGWTPLTHAVIHQDATVVKLMLSLGCDVHVRARDGHTLLQLLKQQAAGDAFGVAKLLQQAGERE